MSAFAAKRIRHLFECCDGRRIPLNAEERSTRRGEVPYWGANSIVDFVDEALFDEELVLLGEDGAPFQDRDQPKAFRINGPVWPNNHIHVLRPLADTHARFMAYAMNHIDYSPYIDGSTRDKLTQSAMSDIKLPCPPSHEQTRIANFLDEQTARIDALIAEKERLDALLGEYRGSLISAAVTGQVDLTTGEALRRVHKGDCKVGGWPITRLRYVADLNPSVRTDLLQALDTEVSFLPMEAIGENGSLSLDRTRPVAEVRNGYSYFENGDIAFAKVTPCFENGKGALMRGLEHAAGFGTTELTVLRPKLDANPNFLNYVLQSSRFRQLGAAAMTGAGGLKRVPDEFTKDFKTAWPVPEDQSRIANFLDERTAQIDGLRSHCREHIALLREYRSSLISAAVTGQLDIDNFGIGG